jgi:hypothetical protein
MKNYKKKKIGMQKSSTFTTIFRVKKCHFHYDMQKNTYFNTK